VARNLIGEGHHYPHWPQAKSKTLSQNLPERKGLEVCLSGTSLKCKALSSNPKTTITAIKRENQKQKMRQLYLTVNEWQMRSQQCLFLRPTLLVTKADNW
jgi:hypothetical protein